MLRGYRGVVRALRSTVLRTAVLVAALGLLVVAAVRHRDALRTALDDIGASGVAVAMAAGIVAIALQASTWQIIMRGMGVRLPILRSAQIFGASAIGKYLPGGVWTAYLQVEMASRSGAPRRSTLAAAAISMVITVVTGAAVGALAIPQVASEVHGATWLLFLLLLPLFGALHPRFLERVILRPSGADGPRAPQLRILLLAALPSSLSWVAFGVHVTALAGQDAPGLPLATAGYALAFTLGFLFLIAPAGAGVRDVALLATLTASLPGDQALAVVLLSRALLTLCDVIIGVLALGSHPRFLRARHPTSENTPLNVDVSRLGQQP